VRLEFTAPTKRDGLKRAAGICECHRLKGIADFDGEGCGQPLGPANTFFEHIICDGLRKDNSLENLAVLTKTCWARKTKWDLATVSTAKRKADRHNGIFKPRSRLRKPPRTKYDWRRRAYVKINELAE
jgi:hypothetical protein